MKRIVSVIVVVALMVAMIVAMAAPAFAASETGNCIGELASDLNQTGKGRGAPGLGGRLNGFAAQSGIIGEAASTNSC